MSQNPKNKKNYNNKIFTNNEKKLKMDKRATDENFISSSSKIEHKKSSKAYQKKFTLDCFELFWGRKRIILNKIV